ncbi:hypothetical protein, partial [Providencia alcalifaciens]|uniref:hypothetical protein n=1 Tax=Providencia alcalifaciens TaxID=126385 RepID=UPI002B059A7D
MASLNNGFFSLDKVWVDDGNVNLSCSFKQNEKLVTASYYITENGISLLSISSDVALVDKLKESPIKIAKSESMMLFRHYVLGMTINGDETYFTNSDVANFIMISGTDSKGLEHNYWFRNHDGALIKPNIPISEDKDSKLEQADSTSLSQNIMLVGFLIDDDNEVFYFYNRASQMIYRQEMNFQKSYSSLSRNISIPNLQDVTFWQGNILAVDKAGVVYQIKANGEFEQVALNESWFVSHPHWWVNLDKDFDKSSTMTLLGIKPINSKEIIPAWYMNGKVFIAHDLPSSSVLKTFGVDGN